ncbi:TPA: pyridoxine 5'-phosphate synthase [Candidatus Scatousia excrementigallinarum]|uniref:Pyridoxine 5'-phosphate synthase n=1 Tax=Candidatus Scatousia excrementigallinarum TaxID=2840935 RepID=A0A9D1JNK6_9BACT|nr:pyridoxine 5'-phosphate synthase [Candidatus Scatousia excrementigallinarum]
MLLGVNIDHVATLRNARGGFEPDLLKAADICEENGGTSITTHLREDRRHIKDEDVCNLIKTIKTKLNLEMAIADDIQKIALEIKPHSICLVPEKRQEVTTEGGLDVAGQLDRVSEFIKPLLNAGIIVSLFIDPDEEQVKASAKTGAQFIEMHTGAYAGAFGSQNEEDEFLKLKDAAKLAQQLGLKVNAGHGLNYENVHRMHEIPGLYELNIGHSIISRAVFTGLAEAVHKMAELIK